MMPAVEPEGIIIEVSVVPVPIGCADFSSSELETFIAIEEFSYFFWKKNYYKSCNAQQHLKDSNVAQKKISAKNGMYEYFRFYTYIMKISTCNSIVNIKASNSSCEL